MRRASLSAMHRVQGSLSPVICRRTAASFTPRWNRELVTIIESIAANGRTAPPFIIFKGQSHLLGRFREADIPPEWQFAFSPNGWTDESLGLEWLKHCFEPFSRPSRANAYQLLLLDGHSSQVTPDLIQFAVEKGMLLLFFP